MVEALQETLDLELLVHKIQNSQLLSNINFLKSKKFNKATLWTGVLEKIFGVNTSTNQVNDVNDDGKILKSLKSIVKSKVDLNHHGDLREKPFIVKKVTHTAKKTDTTSTRGNTPPKNKNDDKPKNDKVILLDVTPKSDITPQPGLVTKLLTKTKGVFATIGNAFKRKKKNIPIGNEFQVVEMTTVKKDKENELINNYKVVDTTIFNDTESKFNETLDIGQFTGREASCLIQKQSSTMFKLNEQLEEAFKQPDNKENLKSIIEDIDKACDNEDIKKIVDEIDKNCDMKPIPAVNDNDPDVVPLEMNKSQHEVDGKQPPCDSDCNEYEEESHKAIRDKEGRCFCADCQIARQNLADESEDSESDIVMKVPQKEEKPVEQDNKIEGNSKQKDNRMIIDDENDEQQNNNQDEAEDNYDEVSGEEVDKAEVVKIIQKICNVCKKHDQLSTYCDCEHCWEFANAHGPEATPGMTDCDKCHFCKFSECYMCDIGCIKCNMHTPDRYCKCINCEEYIKAHTPTSGKKQIQLPGAYQHCKNCHFCLHPYHFFSGDQDYES